MDKHTRRYMYERFDMEGDYIDSYELANAIKDSCGEDDYAYLSSAISYLDDDVERNVLKEALTKRKLGL
jgi:hypothetical protein